MHHLSGEHVAALIATVACVVAAVAVPRRGGDRRTILLSRGLALLILTGYVGEQVTSVVRGTWSVDFSLPLQLTDAVTIVAVVALWDPRPLLVELLYFWALSASLQAVLTPDLGYGFPHVYFVTFFVTHSGAVVAAFLLVFGRRLLPRPGALWRVYALTVGFTALAALGCLVTGGNYMFLRDKPDRGSLLDVMGPWPWYLVAAAALGLVMFLVLDAIASSVRERASRDELARSSG